MANFGDVAIKKVDEDLSQKDVKSGKRKRLDLTAEQEELIVKFYDLFSPKSQFLVEYRAMFPYNFKLNNLYMRVNVMKQSGKWDMILKRMDADKKLQVIEKVREVYVNENLCQKCSHVIVCSHKILKQEADVVIGVIKCNYFMEASK
jgi:hypothetical protein